jgi:rhodanese-related sulfurtransferase
MINLSMDDISDALQDDDFVVIDVREAHEFAMGRIPGSVSMPLSRFNAGDLDRFAGKRIIFSCAAGMRSAQALRAAQAAGLPLNAHYAGGFKDWITAGGAVERD